MSPDDITISIAVKDKKLVIEMKEGRVRPKMQLPPAIAVFTRLTGDGNYADRFNTSAENAEYGATLTSKLGRSELLEDDGHGRNKAFVKACQDIQALQEKLCTKLIEFFADMDPKDEFLNSLPAVRRAITAWRDTGDRTELECAIRDMQVPAVKEVDGHLELKIHSKVFRKETKPIPEGTKGESPLDTEMLKKGMTRNRIDLYDDTGARIPYSSEEYTVEDGNLLVVNVTFSAWMLQSSKSTGLKAWANKVQIVERDAGEAGERFTNYRELKRAQQNGEESAAKAQKTAGAQSISEAQSIEAAAKA